MGAGSPLQPNDAAHGMTPYASTINTAESSEFVAHNFEHLCAVHYSG